MKCKFVVGQKVTPIVSDWKQIGTNGVEPGVILPEMGKTYTIRSVEMVMLSTLGREAVGITLREIRNAPRQYNSGFREMAFVAEDFRAVDERKTDISIFTELLTPAGQKKRILEDA